MKIITDRHSQLDRWRYPQTPVKVRLLQRFYGVWVVAVVVVVVVVVVAVAVVAGVGAVVASVCWCLFLISQTKQPPPTGERRVPNILGHFPLAHSYPRYGSPSRLVLSYVRVKRLGRAFGTRTERARWC